MSLEVGSEFLLNFHGASKGVDKLSLLLPQEAEGSVFEDASPLLRGSRGVNLHGPRRLFSGVTFLGGWALAFPWTCPFGFQGQAFLECPGWAQYWHIWGPFCRLVEAGDGDPAKPRTGTGLVPRETFLE